MVEKKSWEEFRDTGLLWWINSLLHMFGWSVVIELDNGVITNAYPARVKYRGFSTERNTKGYIQVSQYMKDHADELLEESNN